MILWSRGVQIAVERRGYPDTAEYFPGNGFVQLTHTAGNGRSYSTNHAKEAFDTTPEVCLMEHWQRTEP